MVKMELALLKTEVKVLISTAIMAANIRPLIPGSRKMRIAHFKQLSVVEILLRMLA